MKFTTAATLLVTVAMAASVPSSAVADSRPDEDSQWTYRRRSAVADRASGSVERILELSPEVDLSLSQPSSLSMMPSIAFIGGTKSQKKGGTKGGKEGGTKSGKEGRVKSGKGEMPPKASKSSKKRSKTSQPSSEPDTISPSVEPTMQPTISSSVSPSVESSTQPSISSLPTITPQPTGECENVCLLPVDPSECPADPDIQRCFAGLTAIGELCDGDGECNTDTQLDNCQTQAFFGDIYRRIPCELAPSTQPSYSSQPSISLCTDGQMLSCGSVETCRTDGLPAVDREFCGTSSGTGGTASYSIVGTGETITLATCGGFTDFDTKIRVYRNDNGDCVAGNDDFCDVQSSVSFGGEAGVVYDVLVHGFDSSEGTFTLSVECVGVAIAAMEDAGAKKPAKSDPVEVEERPVV